MDYAIDQKPASSKAYFTPAQSNNYYAARYAREGVTLHWWGGNEEEDKTGSIINYLLDQANKAIKSTNYVVSDNNITEMVSPDNVAWCSNAGNPTTISIECEPGLSDEGYKRLGWLIAYLEKRYGHRMNLYPHSKWVATTCPGRISIPNARKYADAAASGGVIAPAPAPAPSPVMQPAPSHPSNAAKVFLPSSAGRWRLYPLDKLPKVGNEKAFLRPDLFQPGLTYDILGWPYGNTVTIQTQQFGKGNIWVGPDTVAQFLSGAPAQVANPQTPGQTSRKLFLPGNVDRWRVYKTGGPWTPGNEVAFLRPALFGGLTYDILGNPAGSIYIIKTQDFGQVAIYAGPDTEAQFK